MLVLFAAPLEEDWDSEEFTGSLANSQVFTPSSGQIHDSRSVRVEEEVSSQQPIDRMDLKTDFTEKTEITQVICHPQFSIWTLHLTFVNCLQKHILTL